MCEGPLDDCGSRVCVFDFFVSLVRLESRGGDTTTDPIIRPRFTTKRWRFFLLFAPFEHLLYSCTRGGIFLRFFVDNEDFFLLFQ